MRFQDNEQGECAAANAIKELNNDFLKLNFRAPKGMTHKIRIKCNYGKRIIHKRSLSTSPRNKINPPLTISYPTSELEETAGTGQIYNEGLFVPADGYYPPLQPTMQYTYPLIIDGRFGPLYFYPQPIMTRSPSSPFPSSTYSHHKQATPMNNNAYSGSPSKNKSYRGRSRSFS